MSRLGEREVTIVEGLGDEEEGRGEMHEHNKQKRNVFTQIIHRMLNLHFG